MKTDIGKLPENPESERALGTEDRAFQDKAGRWYWQARGTRDCIGPFNTFADAKANYDIS